MKIDRDTARGFFGVFLALAIIAGIRVITPGVSSAPDFPCTNERGNEVSVEVSSGESGASIGRTLFKLGVIRSSDAFFRIAVSDPRAGSIAPGSHRISTHICAKDALNELLDSRRISNLIAINEGAWNSEIKSLFIRAGFTRSEVSSGFSSYKVPQGFSSLEGLLFPAQYSFDSKASISSILDVMIARGLKELSPVAASQSEFTQTQILTIASLVQAEGDEKDFSKISQVVRNRLKIGMPLQFDSTIHYIKGSRGSVFLSTQSTFLKSPYNTYRNYGLPPTPINNPGRAALIAAAKPTQGNWLYFITVAPGDTRFTNTLDEFNTWKTLYKKNLKAGKFRSNP